MIARLDDDLLIIVNNSDIKFMAVKWREHSSRKIPEKHLGTDAVSQLAIKRSLWYLLNSFFITSEVYSLIIDEDFTSALYKSRTHFQGSYRLSRCRGPVIHADSSIARRSGARLCAS